MNSLPVLRHAVNEKTMRSNLESVYIPTLATEIHREGLNVVEPARRGGDSALPEDTQAGTLALARATKIRIKGAGTIT